MSTKVSYRELDKDLAPLIEHLRQATSDAERQRVMAEVMRACEPLVQREASRWSADRDARANDAWLGIADRVAKLVGEPSQKGSYSALLASVAHRRAIDGHRLDNKPIVGRSLNGDRMAETRKRVDFRDPVMRSELAREDGMANRDEQLVAGRTEKVKPHQVVPLEAIGDMADWRGDPLTGLLAQEESEEREAALNTGRELLASLGVSAEVWERAAERFEAAASAKEQQKIVGELRSQMGLNHDLNETRALLEEKAALTRLYSEVRDPKVAKTEIDNLYSRPAPEREPSLCNLKGRLGVPKGMSASAWEAERAERRRRMEEVEQGARREPELAMAVGGEQLTLF